MITKNDRKILVSDEETKIIEILNGLTFYYNDIPTEEYNLKVIREILLVLKGKPMYIKELINEIENEGKFILKNNSPKIINHLSLYLATRKAENLFIVFYYIFKEMENRLVNIEVHENIKTNLNLRIKELYKNNPEISSESIMFFFNRLKKYRKEKITPSFYKDYQNFLLEFDNYLKINNYGILLDLLFYLYNIIVFAKTFDFESLNS